MLSPVRSGQRDPPPQKVPSSSIGSVKMLKIFGLKVFKIFTIRSLMMDFGSIIMRLPEIVMENAQDLFQLKLP